MLPDPNTLVRDVDCHLREMESLVERLVPGMAEARKKVEALEYMRRACEAFGNQDGFVVLTREVEPMRERVRRLEERLRAILQFQHRQPGAAAEAGAPVESPLAPSASPLPATGADPEDLTNPPLLLTNPPAPPSANFENGVAENVTNGYETNGGHSYHSPANGNVPPGAPGLRPRGGIYKNAAPAPVLPPDPEDLEKIHDLEEECEREFAKLPFARDDERHALLTVCAAKARRLRTRLHDSYAVDRRLGDLIRRIVDLKRRYRLGWIDGCERSFDVPDWDAYVDRCADYYRELKVREQARHEEARVLRERTTHLQSEVDRRGRELRQYLETEEGRLGTEPEKLRAVLMSYLAVEGALDGELLEKLRIHKNLFTGIAFRRLRKGLERVPGIPVEDETPGDALRARERVIAKIRGLHGVMFAPSTNDEIRRRIESALALDRLAWVDPVALDGPAWAEFTNLMGRGEIQVVLRARNAPPGVWSDAPLREALKRSAAFYFEVDQPEDVDATLGAIERALFAS